MPSRIKAHLAVIAANLFFGITFSMVKVLVPRLMTSYALNMTRIVVALPLFWLLFAIKPGRAGIDRADIPRFILCGLSGVAINQILYIRGLSLTSTIHASLLALGTPIFITAAAAWVLKEKMTWQKITGLTCGIGGAILLVMQRSGHTGSSAWLGDLYVIINSISYAFYFVWVKPLMARYSPIHVIRWVFMFGGLMILPFGWNDFMHTSFSGFSAGAWAAVAVVALGATFFAYLFNMYGIKYLGAAITGGYIYSQPLFAAVISALFLNETFGWQQWLAGLLIATGVFMVNFSRTGGAKT